MCEDWLGCQRSDTWQQAAARWPGCVRPRPIGLLMEVLATNAAVQAAPRQQQHHQRRALLWLFVVVLGCEVVFVCERASNWGAPSSRLAVAVGAHTHHRCRSLAHEQRLDRQRWDGDGSGMARLMHLIPFLCINSTQYKGMHQIRLIE